MSVSAKKTPKKANLVDPSSVKTILDESIIEIVKSRGYKEDVKLSNFRLLIGTAIISVALLAQFYPKKFPENRDFLLVCIGSYVILNGVLQFISYRKEKNAIMYTYPPEISFTRTGLIVSSKLPRFSDNYTLMLASAEPKSITANKSTQFTESVTKWFTEDGSLVEGLLRKDVEELIDDYNNDGKSK